jgi:hypothetical protein
MFTIVTLGWDSDRDGTGTGRQKFRPVLFLDSGMKGDVCEEDAKKSREKAKNLTGASMYLDL